MIDNEGWKLLLSTSGGTFPFNEKDSQLMQVLAAKFAVGNKSTQQGDDTRTIQPD